MLQVLRRVAHSKVLNCTLHTSAALSKIQAGRHRVTRDRSKPLSYEESFWPEEIGNKKGWNSHNTGQLEGSFDMKEEIGQDLPYKLLMEDLFVRKVMNGTFPELIKSEVMVKRQHNLVRVACLMNINGKGLSTEKIYFLIGYVEEFLSVYLKCPVKVELQVISSDDDIIFKYV